ncbi:hypothetical protein NE237_029046 [Protea cynaroides]|uniref:Uncharacterized protein n=1 Tax=Protea cynaroides TaxID=273540 RepID=A0A9Q0GRG2_9MAGN|nr:hypothetical protein NE237_029046 [Protea cynaroides]
MGEDEWVRKATMDDSLVVELLMSLRHASIPEKRLEALLPKWGMKQPRSRQIPRCNNVQAKKDGESRRASPTTPLSWSGGTSFSGSGAVDGYEESSHPIKHSTGVRSKVISTSETTGRRSRKKKTFTELKEEEDLLLKESIQLKKELATLRTDFEELKTRNETLKRMKLDLELVPAKVVATFVELKDVDCDVPDQREANSVDQGHDSCNEGDSIACASFDPDSCIIEKDALLTLPDLNLPFEEDQTQRSHEERYLDVIDRRGSDLE